MLKLLGDEHPVFDGMPTGLFAAGYRQVWRVGSHGYRTRTWEKIVPRINDNILNCGIYLYESENDAREGVRYGGSGFLVGVPFRDESLSTWSHCYAVTNAHVIEKGFPVVRVNTNHPNPKFGTMAIPLSQDNWVCHPAGDDLAIAAIDLDHYVHRFIFISPNSKEGRFFINKEIQQAIALGTGDEVFMVGRFMARDESYRNAPIARFGHLASSETEIVKQGNRKEFEQESFLAEVHSISGSSGSPVFVRVPQNRVKAALTEEEGTLNWFLRLVARSLDYQAYFLGVDWGHLDEHEFPGMAGIVPAWKLTELLNCDKVIQMQNEEEKRVAKQKTHGGKLDVRSKEQREENQIEIPIPTRKQFYDDLAKATRKQKP